MKIVVYCIRHGELDNPKYIIYDREIDLRMTKRGEEQIRELGEKFMNTGVVPDVMYSSPLSRTVQTSKILKEFFPNAKIVKDDRLLERYSKNLAGRAQSWEDQVGGDLYNLKEKDFEIENPDDIAKRMLECIFEKMKKGKIIFFVSHGDPLAFTYYKMKNPDKKLPSIVELWDKEFPDFGQAKKIIFDANGNFLETEVV